MTGEQSVLGCVGRLVVATRGEDGPGEVMLSVRGGSEAYIAWSDEALLKGSYVLVVELRGQRTVEVVGWTDPVSMMPTG